MITISILQTDHTQIHWHRSIHPRKQGLLDIWRISYNTTFQWECHLDFIQGANGSIRWTIKLVPWIETLWCQWRMSVRRAKLASLWDSWREGTRFDYQQFQAPITVGQSWTARSWWALNFVTNGNVCLCCIWKNYLYYYVVVLDSYYKKAKLLLLERVQLKIFKKCTKIYRLNSANTLNANCYAHT